MRNKNEKVIINGGRRIPFAKSQTHYFGIPAQTLLSHTVRELVQAFELEGVRLGELAAGALIKGPDDRNLAREAVLDSGLDPHTPAFDLQRACGTSLETAIAISNKIALGQIEMGIAAGVDTNSDPPMTLTQEMTHALMRLAAAKTLPEKLKELARFPLSKIGFRPPRAQEKRTGLLMGEHCELMAKEWKVSRQQQDELSLLSHQNAAKAYSAGLLDETIVPFHGLSRDPLLRADTSVEKLGRLKPAFDRSEQGTLTAGNSTPLTDGAAALLISNEEQTKKRKLPSLARVIDAQSWAVDFVGGEGLLMAPTYAVAALLDRNNLRLQDFDYYELHEAFAAQVLCMLKAWESEKYCREKLGVAKALGSIDRAKLNVWGSSLAFGHPFAATGARILVTGAKILAQNAGRGRCLVSACTAGGMGTAVILEGINEESK